MTLRLIPLLLLFIAASCDDGLSDVDGGLPPNHDPVDAAVDGSPVDMTFDDVAMSDAGADPTDFALVEGQTPNFNGRVMG